MAEILFLGQLLVSLVHGGSVVKHDLPGEHKEKPPSVLHSSHTCTTSCTSAMSLLIYGKITERMFRGDS